MFYFISILIAEYMPARCGNLSRAILLTDRPIGDEKLNSGGGGVMFLRLPALLSLQPKGGAHVIQLSHYSGTCPKNWCKYMFLVSNYFFMLSQFINVTIF